MFGLLRNLYKWYTTRNEKIVKFALIGIDNAGKSTILARLKGEVPEFITPTIGFASEAIEQGPYHIKIFDLGGGANIRSIWPSYFAEIHGAIFVVDSADKNRLNISRDALHMALQHPRLQKKPLLIFANKQDLPEALAGSDVALNLSLDKFTDYSYNIVSCSAILVGEDGAADLNIQQGLKWLLDTVDKAYSSLEKRIRVLVDEQKEEERIEKEEKRKRIEAMRRERELERERLEKEEKEKENEGKEITSEEGADKGASTNNEQTPTDKEISPSLPNIPTEERKEDLKPTLSSSSSSHSSRTPRASPRLPSLTPRKNAVAPAPLQIPAPSAATLPPISPAHTPSDVVPSASPRSAWATSSGLPTNSSRKKLEPLSLPPSSLQGQ